MQRREVNGVTSTNKPLYMKILEELKGKIQGGEYEPETQLPTEVDLADQYGVSRITSKRALIELEREGLIYRKRGSGSYVKQQEGPASYAGIQSSSPIIAMVLPYMATNELAYIKGASDCLDAKGYFLSIHNSNWSKDKEKELLIKLQKSGMTGVILYPISTIGNVEIVHALSSNNYPIVTVDQYYDNLSVSSVVSDNFQGGYDAASRLIGLGHRRIAFVSSIGIEYRSSVRDRYMGYCQALKENRIPIDPELVYTDFYRDVTEHNAKEFYQSLLQKLLDGQATAIQAEHDYLAVELLKSAAEAGIRIPEMLSIIGFDDADFTKHLEVPLSTLAQDYYTLGRQAAELIMEQIEKGNAETRQVKVPVTLIERQSIGDRMEPSDQAEVHSMP
ncbi:GntR family transcriptional regulator [Paenibacillus sp. D51F]